MVITSAKEVMLSSMFVCLFVSRSTQNLLDRFSQNSMKRIHEPRKKPSDFGVNLDHVTLGLGLGYGTVSVMCMWGTAILRTICGEACPLSCVSAEAKSAWEDCYPSFV